MLQLENIRKYYGDFLATNIPSLFIAPGVWWLQGENGSGKTTLLKMIAGLHPFAGDIILQKQYSIKKQRQQFVRSVNYAEAEPLYPSFLSAKDLVRLYCKTKHGNEKAAKEMLQQLNVLDAYEKQLGSYSSGMIKKVSLALAFIGEAKVILLDEPLITIDTNAVETICGIIRKKFAEGTSFIITSHQPLHAEQLSFTGTLVAANRTIYEKVTNGNRI